MGKWTVDENVEITCEIEFEAGVWTDVSAYLDIDADWFRGKQSENDDIQPGTLTVHLDNSLRTFDPEYADGPYYGNLRPMKRIRLSFVVAATTYTVFTGYVLGWPQQWDTFTSVAPINCIDGSKLDADLPNHAYEAEVLADEPSNYWKLQGGDLSNRIEGQADLINASLNDGRTQVLDVDAPLGEAQVLAAVADTAGWQYSAPLSTLGGVVPEAVEVWTYNAVGLQLSFVVTSKDFIQLQFGGGSLFLDYSDDSANLHFDNEEMLPTIDLSSGLHHVVVFRSGNDLSMMVDGSVLATSTLDASDDTASPPGVRLAASGFGSATPGIAHVATYDTAPSVERFQAHYAAGVWAYSGAHGIYGAEKGGARIARVLAQAGWDSNLTKLDTGATRQGPYLPNGAKALDYIRQVVASEQGLFFFNRDGEWEFRDRKTLWKASSACTFSDDGSDVPYVAGNPDGNSIDTVRNKVTASWQQGAITRTDQDSIGEFGEQPETIDSVTMADAQDASNLAHYVVRQKAEPRTIFPAVEIDMHPDASTQIPAVLSLEIGDLVTVERTPMSIGSQIQKTAQILGIGGRLSPEQLTVTLYLSPPVVTAADAPYLVLGDATLGKIGAAAGNLIPF